MISSTSSGVPDDAADVDAHDVDPDVLEAWLAFLDDARPTND